MNSNALIGRADLPTFATIYSQSISSGNEKLASPFGAGLGITRQGRGRSNISVWQPEMWHKRTEYRHGFVLPCQMTAATDCTGGVLNLSSLSNSHLAVPKPTHCFYSSCSTRISGVGISTTSPFLGCPLFHRHAFHTIFAP